MKRTAILMVVAVIVVAWSGPASAQNTISVQITNISKQIIAPPVVATHTWKAGIFTPGRPASSELAALAEDGDGSALVSALEMNPEVLDVAAAGGMLMPGETIVVELEARGKYNRISAVGMLVSTNDAFFGLDTLYHDRSTPVQRTMAGAWDAGTEYNSEIVRLHPRAAVRQPLCERHRHGRGLYPRSPRTARVWRRAADGLELAEPRGIHRDRQLITGRRCRKPKD